MAKFYSKRLIAMRFVRLMLVGGIACAANESQETPLQSAPAPLSGNEVGRILTRSCDSVRRSCLGRRSCCAFSGRSGPTGNCH